MVHAPAERRAPAVVIVPKQSVKPAMSDGTNVPVHEVKLDISLATTVPIQLIPGHVL